MNLFLSILLTLTMWARADAVPDLPPPAIISYDSSYSQAIAACEAGQYEEAVELFTVSARNGNVEAAELAALLLLDGTYGADTAVVMLPDLARALPLLEIACTADEPNAHLLSWLGWFCEGGGGYMPADYPRAVEVYEKAADLGNAYSIASLGVIYANGVTAENGDVLVPMDRARAIPLLEQAWELGTSNAIALSWLGWFCEGNEGYMPPDYPRAVAAFEKAAALGNAYSMACLGVIYTNGVTAENGDVLVPMDRARAIPLLEQAWELGTDHTTALSWLGWFCEGNEGYMPADYPRAVEIYEKAAALGDVFAIQRLNELQAAPQEQ